jgi:hypothetical protein
MAASDDKIPRDASRPRKALPPNRRYFGPYKKHTSADFAAKEISQAACLRLAFDRRTDNSHFDRTC